MEEQGTKGDSASSGTEQFRAQHEAERGADVTTTYADNVLTAADRCDRCGAQAYVRAIMASGSELLFCAHHWHDNEARLRQVATTIQDESERLVEVPAIAALDER